MLWHRVTITLDCFVRSQRRRTDDDDTGLLRLCLA